MKKVLWFSRHELTSEQKSGLSRILKTTPDDLSVRVLDKTISSAKEIVDEIDGEELIAAVLPVRLLSELMKVLPNGSTVAVARSNKRVRADSGEWKFVYDGWDVIKRCIYEADAVL